MSVHTASAEFGFRERQGHVYSEYVDLLLRRAAAEEGDAAQADLLRAQESMELLKAAELRDYFRDECVDAALARQVSVGRAAADTAVVYPILLEDRIELLVTTSKGIERASVPVGAAEVTREIRSFRELLTKRTTREFLRPAQRLHAWLIAPLAATFAESGVHTLVFVPDGPLRSVPMSALHDGESFLIERYAVAVTPGLRLADPRALDPKTLRILLAGLTEPTSGYEALPGVREELTAVAGLYGGEVLLDGDFQASTVEQKLASEPFNVVHIASHAEFSGDERSTFLLTHDGRMSMQELSDDVGLFRYRDTPLELLALSACETAAGDDRAALGLSGIAVKAGARSALGTLWRVNDEAASQVVIGFYRALGVPGVSRAMALQRAQQAMLAERSSSHPAYWAAFVLIGNWL
jgi:CHAT domain-containing protein